MKESDLSVSLGDGPDQNMHRGQNGSPSSGTILVINNLPDQLQLLSSTLKTAGYDVLEAATPKAALRLAANQKPDLIINDVSMSSETDGLELCRRLRARLDLTSTPILLVSKFRVDTSNAVEGIEAGADHFLQAPYDQLELIARVGQLIERKRTQEALRRSEERYRELFDNANDIVYTHDLEGRYTSINKKGKELTGYTREEAAALDFNTLANPEDVALAKKMLQRKLNGQETSTVYEISILAKDGRIIPVEVNTQLIYENARPAGVQGIARDITKRKESEEALRRATESAIEADRRAITQYESLLERIASLAQVLGSARDLSTIFNALLEFTIASLPCNALGIALYDPEQNERTPQFLWINGKQIEIEKADALPVEASPAGRAILTGEIVISNDFAKDLDGKQPTIFGYSDKTRRPASAMMVPMTIMGRTIGTLEVQSYDLNAYQGEHTTAMRMAANLAANTVQNVRLLAREREHEDQLRQSQKMESIGRLAGGVAHDFNNILTAIYGNCDVMMKRLEPGNELRQHLADIKDCGKRAELLSRQLLGFSRKQALQPITLDLNTVIKDFTKLLAMLIGDNISVDYNLDDQLPLVHLDKNQIEQILMNLAVNSRDAMPKGGRITIETQLIQPENIQTKNRRTKNGHHPEILLTFADTGTGMDRETQKHIFEPFYTTKEEGKGTGLGLSMVYGSIKQVGGNISVKSQPGKGTTFTIRFPAAKGTTEAIQRLTTDQIEHHKASHTILVAEDDHRVRNAVRAALEPCGYIVLEASDGREALELFQETPKLINLIITDLLMPEMNGKDLASKVTQISPDVRILFMSGYPSDTITQEGILQNEISFIHKPFNHSDMVRKVRTILQTPNTVQLTR